MVRHVGFGSYVSIERDEETFARCAFNKPYEVIDMYSGEFSDFLLEDQEHVPSVYWMDLEGTVSPEIFSNIRSIANHVKDGDGIFITMCTELPAGTVRRSERDRKHVLKSRLPSLKSVIERMPNAHFSDKRFKSTAARLLLRMLGSGFSLRQADGNFRPSLAAHELSGGHVAWGDFSRPRALDEAQKIDRLAKRLIPMCPAGRTTSSIFPSSTLRRLSGY